VGFWRVLIQHRHEMRRDKRLYLSFPTDFARIRDTVGHIYKRGQLLVRLRVDKRRVIQEYKLKLLPGALNPKIDSLE
jgi:hypothetical protein